MVHLLQPCLHRAVKHFIFSMPQSSTPHLPVFDCVLVTEVDTSRLLSSLCSSSSATFMSPFVGTLRVSSLNFSCSRKEKLSSFFVVFFLPESLLILAKEQPREVSDDDSHRERADKPVWLWL